MLIRCEFKSLFSGADIVESVASEVDDEWLHSRSGEFEAGFAELSNGSVGETLIEREGVNPIFESTA